MTDGWNAATTYDQFMGRWSRPLAAEFLRWLLPSPGGHWLDVGTGTGALAEAVGELAQPSEVIACDPAEPFIDAARSRASDARLKFVRAGVDELPSRQGGYDYVVAGLALNFFPDVMGALAAMTTSARPGGGVAVYVWDYSGGMEFLRYFWDAVSSAAPYLAELDEGRRFPICRRDALENLFVEIGLDNVRVGHISVPTHFASFDDYWDPFLGGTGPAPAAVSSLAEDVRVGLEAGLRERLPTDSDGRIRLQASAWAAAGTRPVRI